jgi:hypothetical protein
VAQTASWETRSLKRCLGWRRDGSKTFRGGTIAWHPEIGAHFVGGAIGDRWKSLGRDQFGYPTTDEIATEGAEGRVNHFRAMHLTGKPEASIVFSIATQAQETVGAIRAKWAERTLWARLCGRRK